MGAVLAFKPMAGFGIFMAYLCYAMVGLILSALASLGLVFWGRKIVPGTARGRNKFLQTCGWRPFLCLLCILLTWIAYSYVLGVVFDRDNGMSAVRFAPMPNGYTVGGVSYAFGFLLGPGESPTTSYPKDGPNSVAGITYLQESDPYLLGSKFISHEGTQATWTSAKKYFLVDTRSRDILRFDTMDELKRAAAEKGITVEFGENWTGWCWKAYSRYRPTWFDWAFPVCSVLELIGLFGSLPMAARSLRRQASLNLS
jgi:hypothetical protein